MNGTNDDIHPHIAGNSQSKIQNQDLKSEHRQ